MKCMWDEEFRLKGAVVPAFAEKLNNSHLSQYLTFWLCASLQYIRQFVRILFKT